MGPEAVELAASAGLVLDDWQAEYLNRALAYQGTGRWSAFECGLCVPRQNGKGSILEARELAGLFLLEERLLTHTAHEFKTSHEHFLRMATLVDGLPPKYKRLIKTVREANGFQAIELKDGRRLRFLARSGGSGRGFSGDFVALDEGMILAQAAMGALLPTMSARAKATIGGPQLWYAGSAGLGDERSEVFARVRDRALALASSGGDERLLYAEWGAGAPDDHTGAHVDLDDVEAWRAANPTLGDRMELEFVENERNTFDDDNFARERLGLWGGGATGAVIDPDLWRLLGDPTSRPAGQMALAIDVPPEGKRASIARAGLRADGRVHGEVDVRPGTGWAVDRAAEVAKRRNAVVCIDGSSRAASLIPALVEAGVKVVTYSTKDVVRACSSILDKIEEDGFRHMAQPELNIAADAARRRKVGDAWAWHRRDTSVDISPLVALTLASYGLKEEPPKRKTGRVMAA